MVADHQAHAHHWPLVWSTPLKRRLAREGCNFTADHGDAVGSNGGVCNKGGLMVEETMRLPLLIRGPGVPQGTTCNQSVSNLDVPPTILRMCGLDEELRMHGRSLNELMHEPGAAWRSGLMAQHYGLHEPVRQRAWYWWG